MIQLNYPEEKFLWKFFDLYKFISFLGTKEIIFSRLDQFEDEMEICSEDMAFWIKSDLRIAEITSEQKNPSINSEEYEKKGRDFIRRLDSLKDLQKLIYASCFYASNDESLAMWKLYAGVQGVAVKFDSMKLFRNLVEIHKNISDNKSELGGAKMNYINLSNNSPYDENGNIIKLN